MRRRITANFLKALLLVAFLAALAGGLGWLIGGQRSAALFGGEYQEGVLTAYCSIEDVPHIELNGHILVPLQNVASLHCSSRCDAPEPDWPPRGLEELDRDDRPDDEDDEA